MVSGGGGGPSGGQRQHTSIASAIANRPRIPLLDEAPSHFDVETEQRVAENLWRLSCTQVVVAQRLSTVRDADTTVVLGQGSIVVRGSHEELIRRHGYYARLVRHRLERPEAPNACTVRDASRLVSPSSSHPPASPPAGRLDASSDHVHADGRRTNTLQRSRRA